MKKFVSFLLVSAMLVAALSGCTQKDEPSSQSSSKAPSTAGSSEADTSTEPGTFPLVKEKIELTLMMQDQPYLGVMDENEFYKWYEEKTNVHINFIEVEPAAMVEKVNLMLVSGEYPDMMMGTGITPSTEVQYGSQGVFLPLNDYIEKYGVEMKKNIEMYPDYLPNSITAPDGNIYALPNVNDCFHCTYTTKMWVNQTWLDTLGMKAPTTTVEFKDMLTAFKTKDPNKNGKADEIALMGTKDYGIQSANLFLLNSFLYTSQTPDMLYLDNGTVKCAATQPEYKEGLKYINSLVKEGLIDPSSYTQTRDQLIQFGLDPQAVMLGAFPGQSPVEVTGTYEKTTDHRTTNYAAIAPLKGPSGYQGTPVTGQPTYNGYFVVTSACKNPEIAYRWGDGLYGEEVTLASQIGFDGSGLRVCKEGEKGINGKQALYESNLYPDETINDRCARNVTLARRSNDFRLGQYVDYSDPEYMIKNNEVRLFNATKEFYEPYAKTENKLPSAYLSGEESAEVSQITASVSSYITEQMVLFSLGTRDIEKDWDSYIKEFDNIKLARLIEINQLAYDRQYK